MKVETKSMAILGDGKVSISKMKWNENKIVEAFILKIETVQKMNINIALEASDHLVWCLLHPWSSVTKFGFYFGSNQLIIHDILALPCLRTSLSLLGLIQML